MTSARVLVTAVRIEQEPRREQPLVPARDPKTRDALLNAMGEIQHARQAVDSCAARDAVAGLCPPLPERRRA